MEETTLYLPRLSRIENKESYTRFDAGRLSSDGGVLVLREIEKRFGLATRLASNARQSEIGQPWCKETVLRRVQSGKDKMRRFFQAGYRAGTWSRERKIIARIEAIAEGTNIRFVVTNLSGRAKLRYEYVYRTRGGMENMIKEDKLYTRSDRISCHRREANQFWLLPQLRSATFETLRRAFLKIAVRIEGLKSRIMIALPSAYLYHKALIVMAGSIAARGGP